MKFRHIITIVGALLGMTITAQAQTTFSDTFSYNNGALVGQGGWLQIGAVATNPLTVTNGSLALATSGQDAGEAFGFTANSGSLYAGFDLTLSAAQATGDYFFSFNTAATATNYTGRFFAKSSGAGYALGYQMGVTGATPTYSASVLNFNTNYRIVVRYDFVSGAANDQATFYISPVSATELSNTSAVSTITWAGSTAENASLTAVTLRQGTAVNLAPTISSFDNLIVSTSFGAAANISAVPEPSTYAAILGSLSLVGVILSRRLTGRRE